MTWIKTNTGHAMITAKTHIVALIGEPVKHSLSPAMHNAAFAQLGLDWAYVALSVKTQNLAQAVAGMKALNFQGFNATMPHKQALVHLVDELDPFAKFCQAVNTVSVRNGKLLGFNTDGPGTLNALKEAKADLSHVVILGAGGTGSAMALALAQAGSEVVILNRDVKKAEGLAHKIGKTGDVLIEAGSLDEAADRIREATVLCNATSVGMRTNETPISKNALHPGLTIMDAVYAPRLTRLIKDAKGVGAHVVTGDRMLLHQGMIAFERWTGGKAPKTAMENALEHAFSILETNGQNGSVNT
ncbi:shikimate dehydrogenase [Candidatus Micrarchaeota archaeon]|nr:shikimate dehydrogenase [Candidatus Micrarchaeota archaeon]